jgi:hypothetical protein
MCSMLPADVKRFDTLKIGDKITAEAYESVVLNLQAPGQKPIDRTRRRHPHRRQERGHRRSPAHHHRHDHPDRHEGPLHYLQRSERLALQHARRRHSRHSGR